MTGDQVENAINSLVATVLFDHVLIKLSDGTERALPIKQVQQAFGDAYAGKDTPLTALFKEATNGDSNPFVGIIQQMCEEMN